MFTLDSQKFGWVMFRRVGLVDLKCLQLVSQDFSTISNLSDPGYLESPAILTNFLLCNILSFLC